MTRPARWATVLILPLSLGLAWAALRSPQGVPGFAQLPTSPPSCTGQWVADQVEVHATSTGTDANFWSSGVLRRQVCGPGTLSFTASGSPAAGQQARLTVALGAVPLLELAAEQPRAVRLRIGGPGWLTLAFPNDANQPPQDRNLFLHGLKFVPD